MRQIRLRHFSPTLKHIRLRQRIKDKVSHCLVSQSNPEPPIKMIFQRVQNNSAQNAYLSTEIDRQEWELQRLRRETQTQRDQMMRLELERKKRTGFHGL